jgi:hypothetical protein
MYDIRIGQINSRKKSQKNRKKYKRKQLHRKQQQLQRTVGEARVSSNLAADYARSALEASTQTTEHVRVLHDVLQAAEKRRMDAQIYKEHAQVMATSAHWFAREAQRLADLANDSKRTLKEIMAAFYFPDILLCIICLHRPKTVLLLPCHHLCLCTQCILREKLDRCPVCREKILESMNVIIS